MLGEDIRIPASETCSETPANDSQHANLHLYLNTCWFFTLELYPGCWVLPRILYLVSKIPPFLQQCVLEIGAHLSTVSLETYLSSEKKKKKKKTEPSLFYTKRPLSQTTHVDFKQKIIWKHSASFIADLMCLMQLSEFLCPWIYDVLYTFHILSVVFPHLKEKWSRDLCWSEIYSVLSCVEVPNSP